MDQKGLEMEKNRLNVVSHTFTHFCRRIHKCARIRGWGARLILAMLVFSIQLLQPLFPKISHALRWMTRFTKFTCRPSLCPVQGQTYYSKKKMSNEIVWAFLMPWNSYLQHCSFSKSCDVVLFSKISKSFFLREMKLLVSIGGVLLIDPNKCFFFFNWNIDYIAVTT